MLKYSVILNNQFEISAEANKFRKIQESALLIPEFHNKTRNFRKS